MRNKYTEEFEIEMKQKAPTNELEQLLLIARNNFDYSITKKQLSQYLYKRNIKYKNYNENKKRDMGNKIPIGAEYVKPDGMTLIKIAPNKWEYKQRYIYSKYYNIELTNDDYIIFLDQDRTNFDINNLQKISKHESAIIGNQKIFSKNVEATKTAIQVAKLMIKTKKMKKIIEENKGERIKTKCNSKI